MARDCPACGDSDARVVQQLDVKAWHQRVLAGLDYLAVLGEAQLPERYDVAACGRCGLHYADPAVAPGSRWYDELYRRLPLYPAARWEFEQVLSRLSVDARLAELGCGSGAFLRLCHDQGIGATGLDFSSAAIAVCRAQGLDARLLEVGVGAPLPDGNFTVITAFQVLEHIPAPAELFATAAAVAAAEASFWISVPSRRRISERYGEPDDLDSPPHHMTRWTAQALAAVGRRSGWSLETVFYEPLPRKVLLWYAARHGRLYRALRAGQRPPAVERALRYIQYPVLLLQTAGQPLDQGFAMLARFRRLPAGISAGA